MIRAGKCNSYTIKQFFINGADSSHPFNNFGWFVKYINRLE